ncbi:MAG: hypothetical protein HY550_09830 [Elusimicrobia bacterium]|nr:hypothetical protein [Elusimicrobiota bacterium]
METIFSKMLKQLRKDAGFDTAYRFYHDNGGREVLKISYRKYLLIEQGRILPVLERLGIFLFALRIVNKSAEANAFVAAWLKTMAGEENFREIIEPLITAKQDTPGFSPMQKAMKKALDTRKYYLTPEQIEVMFATRDNYLCYLALSNDTGAWTSKEFAARLGLARPRAEKALKALAGAKIVKEVKKNVYKCPLAGAMVEYPHLATLKPGLLKKVRGYDDELVATGAPVWTRSGIIRADETVFRSFFPVMGVNISTAQTYAVTEKTEKSALFMVEGKITKLRGF